MKIPSLLSFIVGYSLLEETLCQDLFPNPPAPSPSAYYSKGGYGPSKGYATSPPTPNPSARPSIKPPPPVCPANDDFGTRCVACNNNNQAWVTDCNLMVRRFVEELILVMRFYAA